MIKIDSYLSPECVSEKALRENIYHALKNQNDTSEVNIHRIDDPTAIELGLTGSPSVFINGKELQPQKQKEVGFL